MILAPCEEPRIRSKCVLQLVRVVLDDWNNDIHFDK